ncbi:MAG: LacI family DNA-binding transcriptional regulator [Devosiaceae bacterium]
MIQKPATIQDVARVAGVSAATVSRALSNPAILAEATREVVFEAIATTGYRVNQAARNLRMQRAGAVLIMVPDLGKPFYSKILSGISDVFAQTDYAVLIADTESRPMRDDQLVDLFNDGRIDGMISLDGSTSKSALEKCQNQGRGERIVFLCEWVRGADFPVINCDNADGAFQAMKHLVDLGHRRIAHVLGPHGNVLSQERRKGVEQACEQFGLDLPHAWMIEGDFSVESGHHAAREILAMKDQPTAVFCAADTAAFGLVSGLQAGGMTVPNDISVVGFDDIDISQYYMPALTTIRQDRHLMGRRAAERLLSALQPNSAADSPAHLACIPVSLVVRSSTAAPAAS